MEEQFLEYREDYVKNVFRIYDTKIENLGNIETISFENIIFKCSTKTLTKM